MVFLALWSRRVGKRIVSSFCCDELKRQRKTGKDTAKWIFDLAAAFDLFLVMAADVEGSLLNGRHRIAGNHCRCLFCVYVTVPPLSNPLLLHSPAPLLLPLSLSLLLFNLQQQKYPPSQESSIKPPLCR